MDTLQALYKELLEQSHSMSKNNGFGTRGIPDVLGGVETHCQNLYPAIKQQFDVDICVIARSPYVNYKTIGI